MSNPIFYYINNDKGFIDLTNIIRIYKDQHMTNYKLIYRSETSEGGRFVSVNKNSYIKIIKKMLKLNLICNKEDFIISELGK